MNNISRYSDIDGGFVQQHRQASPGGDGDAQIRDWKVDCRKHSIRGG